MQSRFSVGVGVLASLVAACSGQTTSSLLPGAGASPGNSSAPAQLPTVAAVKVDTANPLAQTIMQGTVVSVQTGRFVLKDIRSGGYVPVSYLPGTPINTYSAPLAVGRYAITVGSGSSGKGEVASYIAMFPSAPSSLAISGTIDGIGSYGIVIKDSASGSMIPVMLSDQTHISGALLNGASASVSGNGTTAGAVLAGSVVSGSSSTPTPVPTGGYPGSIPQTHLVTGDYLGSPWGSSVSPSQAAPYLSWVQTGISNVNGFADAGIKTEVYFSPDLTQTNDPLYSGSSGSEFATTCSAARVWDKYGNVVQYLMNPESSAYRAEYAAYVAQIIAGSKVDAIFEDNGSLPSHYAPGYLQPSMPCEYNDTTWLNAEAQLQDAAPIPTIINGLSGLYGHGLSPLMGLMTNPNTMGGNFESCISNTEGNPNNGVWVWQDTEDSQIAALQRHKVFQCMGLDRTPAASSYAPRIYMLASFLMTYDPGLSTFWESYATASGLHVMPESKLVALYAVVPQPATIAALKTSAGPYVRAYHACYYAGKLIGACEMVVNSDYYPEPTPSLYTTFHHTLAVSGSGVLEGGSVSLSGAAPPSTMAGETGFVALP